MVIFNVILNVNLCHFESFRVILENKIFFVFFVDETELEPDSPSPPVPSAHISDTLRIHNGTATATHKVNEHRRSMRGKVQLNEQDIFGKHSPQIAAKRGSARGSTNILGVSPHSAAPRTSQQFNPGTLRLSAMATPTSTTPLNGANNPMERPTVTAAVAAAAAASGAVTADTEGHGTGSTPTPSPSDDDSRCLVM